MFKFIEQINKHSYTLKWTKKVCAFIYPILESNHAIMAGIQGPNNYEYWIIELKQTNVWNSTFKNNKSEFLYYGNSARKSKYQQNYLLKVLFCQLYFWKCINICSN